MIFLNLDIIKFMTQLKLIDFIKQIDIEETKGLLKICCCFAEIVKKNYVNQKQIFFLIYQLIFVAILLIY
jgi:hypothetical protein